MTIVTTTGYSNAISFANNEPLLVSKTNITVDSTLFRADNDTIFTNNAIAALVTQGSAAGTATVTGVIILSASLTGSSDGSSTVSGTLVASATQIGTANGTTTVNGLFVASSVQTGSSNSTSNALGTLAATSNQTGSSTGLSTASSILVATSNQTGSSTGLSTASSILVATSKQTGTANGTSSADGIPQGLTRQDGVCTASSTATATLVATSVQTGVVNGVGDATGIFKAGATQQGSTNGTSNAGGTILAILGIQGTSNSSSSATGVGSFITGLIEVDIIVVPSNVNTGVVQTEDPLFGESETVTNTYLPTIYSGTPSSYELSFFVRFASQTQEVVLPITSIYTNTTTKMGQHIRVQNNNQVLINGKSAQIPYDAFYQFTMKDNSIKQLSPYTKETIHALNRYKSSSVTDTEITHVFNLRIPKNPLSGEEEQYVTFVMSQIIMWNYKSDIDLVVSLSKQIT